MKRIKPGENIIEKIRELNVELNTEKIYIQNESYGGFFISNHYSNCKLMNVESIQNILHRPNEKKDLERLDTVLDYTGRMFFTVTLIDTNYIETLEKYYILLGKSEVPIGYGKGLQYHCTFGRKKSLNSIYGPRIKALIGQKKEKDIILTPKIKEKILGYKRKAYLSKYLDKLINGETL